MGERRVPGTYAKTGNIVQIISSVISVIMLLSPLLWHNCTDTHTHTYIPFTSSVELNCHGNAGLKRFPSSSAMAGIQREDVYKCKHLLERDNQMLNEVAQGSSKTQVKRATIWFEDKRLHVPLYMSLVKSLCFKVRTSEQQAANYTVSLPIV